MLAGARRPPVPDRPGRLRRPPRDRPRDAAAVRRARRRARSPPTRRSRRSPPGHEERVALYQLFPLLVHAVAVRRRLRRRSRARPRARARHTDGHGSRDRGAHWRSSPARAAGSARRPRSCWRPRARASCASSRGDGHRRQRARRRRADRRAGRRRRSTSSSTTPARSEIKPLDEVTDDDWYEAVGAARDGVDAADARVRARRWPSAAGAGSSTSRRRRASGRRRPGPPTRSPRPPSSRSRASVADV